MTTSKIRIRTEGFRAINKSDIIIDGITVVAGENGSGKSTISKLLYYLYKTAANYEDLVAKVLLNKLRNIDRFLDITHHEIFSFEKDKIKRDELRKELMELKRNIDIPLHELEDKWIAVVTKFQIFYNLLSSETKEKGNERINQRLNRLKYILRDVLNQNEFEIDENNPLPFEKVIERIQSFFKEAYGKIESRPISLFNEALADVFSAGDIPKLFEVLEFEQSIISTNNSHLSIPYVIQNAIYIDTPMMIGEDSLNNEYWQDLNDLLIRKGKSTFSSLTKTISNEIINGDVSVDDMTFSTNDFNFKRSDGSIYNLLDCATGIKSFAIIQLLLKNGSLTDKTLLIIDEPESHLHPQWIIEYARLIVLLNKEIGTKFFIASHNPDMVSAIKYIAEKEGVSADLNFYLAESTSNKFLYNYKHLKTEIDPIFSSFNIAIERINKYGV